jgi:hypothetical protein
LKLLAGEGHGTNESCIDILLKTVVHVFAEDSRLELFRQRLVEEVKE